MAGLIADLLRRKPVTQMVAESGSGELARSFGLFPLVMLGIGATIGTGVYFLLTETVPQAGPAVVWSFLIAGAVAGISALCYAEFAGAVPIAGSSYSYIYATLGELAAMIVGACLLLEYGVSAAAVAVGWSQYLNQLLDNVFGFRIPEQLANAPEAGGIINLPAVLLIALCALLLIRGATESVRANAIMTTLKLGVLGLFILIGATGWNSDNLAQFAPFGFSGVISVVGAIFFTFVGLDAVSTAGEEVRNPRRNLPLAVLITLLAVTATYIAVAIVAVAAQPVERFEGQKAGLAAILQDLTHASWPGTLIAAGAVLSIFSATLVTLYGQTRVLYAMGRDGLVPPIFHRVDPRTRTPIHNTLIVTASVALLAGLLPITFLAELTSIGTLVAFSIVAIGLIVLRRTAPELPRSFRVPGYPVTPVLSVVGCGWIILTLKSITIWAFLVWAALAVVVYFAYSRKHSRLADSRVG
ncbi:APC family permease [Amycolatopsis jejuensis]|uniref:APC family permease n=1 Tax=Amycolatopsis jejuensis TaxID=330084 RepID=UPI0005277DE6|nr:amino acid permease [Amycolatopsis jejuensis]